MKYAPQILIAIGMIFTFWGGLLAFKRQNEFRSEQLNQSIENKKLTETNISLTRRNESLINNNITLTEKNQNLLDKNIGITQSNKSLGENNLKLTELTNELTISNINLTRETKAFTIGSDHLLKMDFGFDLYSRKIQIRGSLQDDVPIYDLKMHVIELFSMPSKEFKKYRNKSVEHFKQHGIALPTKNKTHVINIDIVRPKNYQQPLGFLPKPIKENGADYRITVSTRARLYYMLVFVRKSNNDTWTSHSEFYEDFLCDKLIEAHTMHNYPILENGKPDKRLI